MSRPQSASSTEPSDNAVKSGSRQLGTKDTACFHWLPDGLPRADAHLPGQRHYYELQAEFSSAHPSVHVKIFKDGPQRFLAVSAQLDVIAFGATPEEAAAEAFVGDASDHVQRERAKGRSGLIDVSKEEDPEKQLEERLKDLLSDLGLQDELPHSSVDATCG